MDNPKFVVVIGDSAGGLKALLELVGQLNPDMDAAFFITSHYGGTTKFVKEIGK